MKLVPPAWALAQVGLDAAIAVGAALAWGFAAFVIGSRFLSPLAGGMLGLAVVASAAAILLAMHLRDRSLTALASGACPRCQTPIQAEHRHRSWDIARNEWVSPFTAWECAGCTFAHQESWDCPACQPKD